MSKEKLLLVGAGGFGRIVAEQAMLQYNCAFVDDGQAVGTDVCGIPVAGGLADLPELRKEYGLLVVGIGNNRFRAQVYEKAKALAMRSQTLLLPVPTSVRLLKSAVAVWFARLYPERCVCRKRCSAECRNRSPL